MCVILDVNAFSSTFDSKSENHKEFKPVLNWIVFGKGKLVYGGNKYKEELKKASKYLRLITQLAKANKVVVLDDQDVDSAEKSVSTLETNPDFDDPHLIAIVIVSKCRIVCTNDKRAVPHIKNPKLYPKNISRPMLYMKSDNSDLLVEHNIADCCKPCDKLPKAQRSNLGL